MGTCTTKAKKPPPSSKYPRAAEVAKPLPIDTSEEYNFLVKIAHIKLRGLALNSYYLVIVWGSQKFKSDEKTGSEIKFSHEWTFTIKSTVERLREEYMSASLVLQKSNQPLAQVDISVWSITVGPSYQNFALFNSDLQVIGRLGMDVKMLQQTTLQVEALEISCELDHEAPGYFSVNLYCPGAVAEESAHSPVSEMLKWVFPKDEFDEIEKIELKVETNIEDLRTDSMQVRVWRHRKREQDQVLVGECWMGLSRLLKDEKIGSLRKELSRTVMKVETLSALPNSHSNESIMRKEDAKVTTHFSEKLWSSGRQIGIISGEIQVTNIPCISQLISGVNTEEGIQIQSTNFVVSKAGNTAVVKKVELPAVMLEISNLMDELKQFVVRKPGMIFQLRGSEVTKHIEKVNETILKLKETEKETMTAHIYNGEIELTTAQHIFLDLGEHILKYADIVAVDIRSYYYDCLNHLIRRGELDLGHMDLMRTKDNAIHSRKMEVAVRYRAFLHKLLICALAKMNIKGIESKVQKFTETIVATAYFRIPEFKERVLNCLKQKSFDPVPEWRGTVWDLESDVTTHSEFLPMFDWTHYFYGHLPIEENEKYQSALNETRWQHRLEKRGIAYFRFVTEWASDVKRLFVHKLVPWHEIPGYSVILKSFLLEMKARNVEEYPEAMVKASQAVLHNPSLISIFIVIVFNKTNLYRFKQVMETFKLITQWLIFMYEKKYQLPVTFVSSFFLKGIKAALKCEIALNVASALLLLYWNYQIFTQEIKKELVLDLILGVDAFKLMFHWSEYVRQLFWDFFFFRIQSLAHFSIEPVSCVDSQITSKSEEYISVIETLEDNTSEHISQEMLPYTKLSYKEYQQKREAYETWLKGRLEELRTLERKAGKYGQFDEFPYPNVNVERVFEDEFERRLVEKEEW